MSAAPQSRDRLHTRPQQKTPGFAAGRFHDVGVDVAYMPLTMFSVIFFASPSSIMVLSR
jgi:hypothetical protein